MALTPEQRAVVDQRSGHSVVIAGPGSGKTHTITEQIIALLESEAVPDPFGILALTFTSAAAREMRKRLSWKGFGDWHRVWCGTYHAFCHHLLGRYASDIGIPESTGVADQADVDRILVHVCDRHKMFTPRNLKDQLQRLKREGIYPANAAGTMDPDLLSAYEDYQQRLEGIDSYDYGDLIARTLDLLERSPFVLDVVRNKFRYIVVDEFQDTDNLQLRIVELLATDATGSTIVADDDQAIYEWRGAVPENVSKIASRLNAQEVVLGVNFRSDQAIINAALAIASHGSNAKPQQPASDQQGRAALSQFADVAREAAGIVAEIGQLTTGDNAVPYEEIAIITRTRDRAEAVLDQLDGASLPWFDQSRLQHFDSWEVRLGLAMIGIAADPTSGTSLAKLIRALDDAGVAHALGLEDSVEKAYELRNAAAKAASLDWRAEPVDLFEATGIAELVTRVASSPSQAKRCQRNLKLLGQDVVNEAQRANIDVSAAATRVLGGDAIQVMRGHGAKGREFDVVFVVGVEDDKIPSHYAHGDDAKLAEERRVLYVAMTRARNKLYLSHVGVFEKGYRRFPAKLSRFVQALPTGILADW